MDFERQQARIVYVCCPHEGGHIREYNIFVVEIQDLCVDSRKSFVEMWKGPECNNFKKQQELKNFIPHSIVQFMEDKIKAGL